MLTRSPIPFTVKRLESLPNPQGGERHLYRDCGNPGLAIIVGARSKVFYLEKKVNGRARKIKLGRLGEISLAEAKELMAEKLGEIAKGDDPAEKKQAERRQHKLESHTLVDLFEKWLEYAKTRKKTWPESQRQFDVYFDDIRNERIGELTETQVADWHMSIGKKHGLHMANRVLELLRAMYNRAARDFGLKGWNPADDVEKFPEASRERYILPEEMPAFFEAVDAEEPLWRDLVYALLFTGQRHGNVKAMRWDSVDLERGLWRLQGEEMKNGSGMEVVLSPEMIAILKERQGCHPVWVFPSKRTDGHIDNSNKAWKRIIARSGLEDLRQHDLRRTLGSYQAMAGVSLLQIGKSLGHKSQAAAAIYSRLRTGDIDSNVKTASSNIARLGRPTDSDTEQDAQPSPSQDSTSD